MTDFMIGQCDRHRANCAEVSPTLGAEMHTCNKGGVCLRFWDLGSHFHTQCISNFCLISVLQEEIRDSAAARCGSATAAMLA